MFNPEEQTYIQKLFSTINNPKFQAVLADPDNSYQEIILAAPAAAWDIFWNLPDMPADWARAILEFATIKLSPKQVDKLIKNVGSSSYYSASVLAENKKYRLSQAQVYMLVKSAASDVNSAMWLLEQDIQYELEGLYVFLLVESVLQSPFCSRRVLQATNERVLSRKLVNALFKSAISSPREALMLLFYESKYDYLSSKQKVGQIVRSISEEPEQAAQAILCKGKVEMGAHHINILLESALRDIQVAHSLLVLDADYRLSAKQVDKTIQAIVAQPKLSREVMQGRCLYILNAGQVQALFESVLQDLSEARALYEYGWAIPLTDGQLDTLRLFVRANKGK